MAQRNSPPPRDWTTLKVSKGFARWLKIEAARQGVYMGDLIERLASEAIGGHKPWNLIS